VSRNIPMPEPRSAGRGPAPQGEAVADDTVRKDEAYAAIVAAGKRYEVHIGHASGTADNPMSDTASKRNSWQTRCR